ncbi:hypothetical protein C8Q78DRAFT_279837 [Trametes maxima]|nr:hypothetical protein C8Q78DRAFT_279837 [Trametes maxima]
MLALSNVADSRPTNLQRFRKFARIVLSALEHRTSVFRAFHGLRELHISGDGYPTQLLALLATKMSHGANREGVSSLGPVVLRAPGSPHLVIEGLLWRKGVLQDMGAHLQARAHFQGTALRQLHNVGLRGRQKDAFSNREYRGNLATLRNICDMVYKDSDME